jgi:restriction endonuclease S subunit
VPPINIHIGNNNYLRIGEFAKNSYINLEKLDDNNVRKSGITLTLGSVEALYNAVCVTRTHIYKHNKPQKNA